MRGKFPFLITLIALALAACIPGLNAEPAYTQDQISTFAVETAFAQLTLNAPQATSTPTPLPETIEESQEDTPAAPTPISETNTPSPTISEPALPTPTPVFNDACDRVKLIGEVSVDGDAVLIAGEKFTKTWRLQNTGNCTWSGAYAIAFVDGDLMNGPYEINLNSTVRPGEIIDLSLKLTAPEEKGRYSGEWKLQNAGGQRFGPAEGKDFSLWVNIEVGDFYIKQNPNVVFSFLEGFCAIHWVNGQGITPQCAAEGNIFELGGVYRMPNLITEGNYEENEPALITIPNNGEGGMITGYYPPFRIKKGDWFLSYVGCLAESPLCDVTFELNYRIEGGEIQNLGRWTQIDDGEINKVLISLSSLADSEVEFILTVRNNGISVDDRAFWIMPVIIKTD